MGRGSSRQQISSRQNRTNTVSERRLKSEETRRIKVYEYVLYNYKSVEGSITVPWLYWSLGWS